MKTLNTLLGFFILITVLSGCSARSINTPAQSTKEPFVLFNPLTDDPDNPSPHNPLIKKYGDIPEVRTYIRYYQKLHSGTPLTVDEAIAYYSADLYLYPYPPTEVILKTLKDTKKRHETLGFPADTPVLRYTGGTTHYYSRGASGYYNVRTLPDGTRIINDKCLPGGKAVIPPKEKSKSEGTAADAHDQNSVPTEDEE
jgi:hypothetical protein